MNELIEVLKERFEKNSHRHPEVIWSDVQKRLEADLEKGRSLQEMEKTGGEPDVLGAASETGEYLFCDFSAESPKGRRSVCYDREARESRKKFAPETSAVEIAENMGIVLLTEEQYRKLQGAEKVDQKTSSWILTPGSIRERGGALFCDRRYDQVFVYHNGAESYYSTRGFRGCLSV
ncbi:DUF4256 domain-containing protein [Alkalicoccus halolimnae]|uniref:DUF4256 domain-containing protein n=1 Tax=Alkalicoccus halolimnae TaxID=1667239 RepID=A0A5C7F4I7_9BACI|nr:DUF4256 domain-containing protein [Alkalicoccus halolimnae]TXF84674.1 DUF4256 domain-containing protein [Alkalicoccus halolimnae]